MLIEQTLGNIYSTPIDDKTIDLLELEWYETSKRILTRQTKSGKEIQLRFLKEYQQLHHGDILYVEKNDAIVVEILICEALLIVPADTNQLAAICYEIGNRHMPLFYQDNEILIPYEEAMLHFFKKHQFKTYKVMRRLISQVKTTIAPHGINFSGPVTPFINN